jgi:SOS response regulatory protein OraA/RecX
VELALDRLESLKLLNDEEYAYNFAFSRIKQRGWSAARVANALLSRQVEQTAIDSALARIRDEGGEESSLALCVKLFCAKYGEPSGPKGFRKIISHLRRHGFNDDDIFRTLGKLIPGAFSQRFETGE